MRQRIITAIVFVAVMLAGLFGGVYAFGGLVLFIGMMSLYELMRIEGIGGGLRQIVFMSAGISPVLLAFAKMRSRSAEGLEAVFLWSVPVVYLILAVVFFRKEARGVMRGLLGVAYIGIPLGMLVLLARRGGGYNPWTVAGFLALIWLNDTGAYFTGKFFGKHKLAPAISPKKTWEGLIGGIAAAILTAWLLSVYLPQFTQSQWLILGLLSGAGILGDLFESRLKRNAGIKDSGGLMPGHGGVLDRFDAFFFILPLIFLYLSNFAR